MISRQLGILKDTERVALHGRSNGTVQTEELRQLLHHYFPIAIPGS